MIVTFTPNPALDLGGVVKEIVANEKSYVHQETRYPGGNAVNAGRIMNTLGADVVVGGFLGGCVGQEIAGLLEREGISTQFVSISGASRISVTVSSQNTHLQTRLSFPGPKIRTEEIQSLHRWISTLPSPFLFVIGGSLPPGFSSTALRSVISLIRKRHAHCVLDVPGPILKEVLSSPRMKREGPLLIKPNLTEFQQLTRRSVSSISEVLKVGRKLTEKVPFVCVSSVEGGALLITRDYCWFGKTPVIQVRSTVGAGDSMVGAMSAQLWKWMSGQEQSESYSLKESQVDYLLRLGLASAAATLINPGTRLGKAKDIRSFISKVKTRRIA